MERSVALPGEEEGAGEVVLPEPGDGGHPDLVLKEGLGGDADPLGVDSNRRAVASTREGGATDGATNLREESAVGDDGHTENAVENVHLWEGEMPVVLLSTWSRGTV